jgi:hypothetical protein
MNGVPSNEEGADWHQGSEQLDELRRVGRQPGKRKDEKIFFHGAPREVGQCSHFWGSFHLYLETGA